MSIKLLLSRGWVFLATAGIYLLGQYLRGEWFLGTDIPNLCGNANVGGVPFCNSQYLDSGWALIVFSEYLLVVALILLFANNRGRRVWLWFSAFFVPLAGLATFSLFPEPFIAGTVLDQTFAAGFFGGLYIIVTLVIVLFCKVRDRKGK